MRVYDWNVYSVVTGMTPFARIIHHSRSPLVTRGIVPRGRHRQALSDISAKSKFYIPSNLKSAPREKHVSSCVFNVRKSMPLWNLLWICLKMWYTPIFYRKMMINNRTLGFCPKSSKPKMILARSTNLSPPQAETVNQTALFSPGPLCLQQHITARYLRRWPWGHSNTQTRAEILL